MDMTSVRVRLTRPEYEDASQKARSAGLPIGKYLRAQLIEQLSEPGSAQPAVPSNGKPVDPRELERALHAAIKHEEIQTALSSPLPTADPALVDKCVDIVGALRVCNGSYPQLTRAAYLVHRARVCLAGMPSSDARQRQLQTAEELLREKINMCLRFSRDRRMREARQSRSQHNE